METNNRYTQPEWESENRRYYCMQNGLGQWWPGMEVRTTGGSWYPVILRDSNPFKTLKGAIRFLEQQKARIESRKTNN
jgi:hypothetical protein